MYFSASNINKYLFQQISNNYYHDHNTNSKIVFKPDKICSTTLEWLVTDISIEQSDNTIYIQSPIFITYDNSIVYKNYYYFKILSPAQILELINIDLHY
jgi:hypothetical protein